MNTVEVIQLIKTTLTKRGSGESMDDVVRVITQYWRMDGTLEFEVDPCPSTVTKQDTTKSRLACPFCGQDKYIGTEMTRYGTYQARCDGGSCGALGPMRPTEDEAMSAWTNREH